MESENDVAAECYYNSGGSNYCCVCDAYDVNPIIHEGKSYCRRCATKYVPEDQSEDEHGTERRIAESHVNVPFELQQRLLDMTFFSTLHWLLCELDNNDNFAEEIEELAEKRLAEGYGHYGSKMYGWDEETRRRNIMEELADMFVYASSGRFGEMYVP